MSEQHDDASTTEVPPSPEQVAESFGLIRVHRTTGAFYRRTGRIRFMPDVALRPDDWDWEWEGHFPNGELSHRRRADHHVWGPAWVEFRLAPTGTDVTNPGPRVLPCGRCTVGRHDRECPVHGDPA